MKIGVIGIGEIGGTIAARLSRNGHRVRVANSRGPDAWRRMQTIYIDRYGLDGVAIDP